MSDIGDFITENIDFSQVEFHYLIDFENGNTISIMRNDFTFGNEVGLIETAVAGENVDKFFERLFGWMTVDEGNSMVHICQVKTNLRKANLN